ncbi:MAG TPA: sulfite exporter TauE/SafE family protein [Vicinamibacteria bacterium]|nr:sulfite exporter TauE/SafE family protein [Vicinamibacteria bacterium]
MPSLWPLLAIAGFAAGLVNAIAGGGSLISFPALVFIGIPPVTANATNTLALWPGSLSSVWAYRRHIAEERHRAVVLAVPSMVGGLAGSILLLNTSERAFRAVVPWLILFACALLAFQGPVARLLARAAAAHRGRVPVSLWLAQLLISVYGGYFGAGIGILMLAAMAILLPDTLQHANALKVLFATLINGIAAIYFLAVGAAELREAALMAATSLVGGYTGAHLAQRMPAGILRAVVVAYGVVVAGRLLWTG